ncbi:MAG: glycosyltransferase family 4 protein [Flavobacteriales bacterium]|nr:glycosyltransferase family 4 protein [Flavobacteriales bacterium]
MSKNAPNILFIVKWFPHPGDRQFGVFTLKHAQCVAERVNLGVLHLCPMRVDHPRIVREEMGNVVVHRLEFPEYWNVFRKTSRLPASIREALDQITSELGTPDLVHVHILGMPVLIARYHFPTTPLMISEHWTGFVNGYFARMPIWKQRWFKTSTRKAFLTTVPSEHLRDVMINELGFPGRFETLPNVIDIPEQLTSTPPERTQALVVADLHDHNKNISGLLRVWADVRPDARLTIIGDGHDREQLEALSRELELSIHEVEFLGRVDNREVFTHLANASFLIVNSRFETFSMITTEALGLGLPVLATRCGGPEQFVDTENGILIPPDDPAQLREALLRMLETHRNYDRPAISRSFRTRYSSKAVGDRIMDLYNEALGKT